MRAEVQNNVDAIGKSVALLKRRLDWETAPHRMEEFNAMIEDPTLWDDPERAQKLMRDRQALMDSIEGIEALERETSDNVEMIGMGELEDDAEIVAEAEAAIARLVETAAEKELEALLDGEADGNDSLLEINSGAGGTESICWRGCIRVGPKSAAIPSSCSRGHRGRKSGSSRRPTRSAARMPMAG